VPELAPAEAELGWLVVPLEFDVELEELGLFRLNEARDDDDDDDDDADVEGDACADADAAAGLC
jgi:hypothetical protein